MKQRPVIEATVTATGRTRCKKCLDKIKKGTLCRVMFQSVSSSACAKFYSHTECERRATKPLHPPGQRLITTWIGGHAPLGAGGN